MHVARSIRLLRSSAPAVQQARRMHTSSRLRIAMAGAQTQGQAPPSSRQPLEHTHLEQNPHLKHAASSEGGDKGRDKAPPGGNASDNPELPSHRLESSKTSKSTNGAGRRALHTSGSLSAARSSGDGGHSTDSYSKDVDYNPPTSSKTHSVGGDDATTAHRPNEQYADPKKQYASVSNEEPYQPKTSSETETTDGGEGKEDEKDANTRYGGMQKDAESDASHSSESAAEGNAGGRKPEGRS